MPELKRVKVSDLVPAEWNYKKDDDEKAIKLCKSIEKDKSAGVPAVRKLGDKYEVIDGNHRLKALQTLGWEELDVEDFGEISKATAITIARRRNSLWFEDDILKYSELLNNEVLKEYDLETLSEFMVEGKDELKHLAHLSEFDWKQFDVVSEDDEWVSINFKVSKSQYQVIRQALDKIIEQENLQNNPNGMALEFLAADFLGK